MASLSKTSANGWTVQVCTVDGKRKSIRLEHHLTKQQAIAVKGWIERLNASQLAGLPFDEETARWLSKLGDLMHDRIAATGLTTKRTTSLLGPYLQSYIEERSSGVSNATVKLWRLAAGNLTDYFGADQRIQLITSSMAKQWREWMLTTLAENTVRRRTGHGAQLFEPAVKARQIAENPFDGLPMSVLGGQDETFVPILNIEKIFAECQNPHARLYLALARYGGLRCPSEVRNLYWSQVAWREWRILITSPKTKRFAGKSERFIPLFKVMEPYLLECYTMAPEGDSLVIPKLFDAKYLKRIVEQSGVSVWERFFQSLRTSRQNELLSKHPRYIVDAILGHSRQTAARFYDAVAPDDFKACIDT